MVHKRGVQQRGFKRQGSVDTTELRAQFGKRLTGSLSHFVISMHQNSLLRPFGLMAAWTGLRLVPICATTIIDWDLDCK